MNIRKTLRTSRGKRYTYFTIAFRDPGTGKQRVRYFKSRREAADEAPKLLQQVHEGRYNANSRTITLGELAEAWRSADYSPRRTAKIRTATRISYESALKRILKRWGTTRLVTIQASHIEQWRDQLLAQGDGAATVQKVLAVLTLLYGFAQRDHLAAFNPVAAVRQPSIGTRRALAFAPHELPQVFAACTGRMRVAVMIAGLTGMRRGEILGLKWGAVDLEQRQIHVREQWADRDKCTSELKTEAGRRTVAIPSSLAAALAQYKLSLPAARKRAEDFVLATASGRRPMDPANFTTSWHRALKRAGLSPRPFHCLRHTAATALVSAGVAPGVVHRVLGHTDYATTLALYGGTTAEALASAAAAIENATNPYRNDKQTTNESGKG